MIRIAVGQLAAAVLLLCNAYAIADTGNPVLLFFDLLGVVLLVWTCTDKIDPPSDGARAELRV